MSLETYKAKILRFYEAHTRMPSYGELATLLGFKSKNAAYKVIQKLEEVGLIARDAQGKIVPAGIWGGIRMLGLVEAGFPSAAEEDITDTLSLDDYLIDRKESSFMLKVKGDSMIDAGIQEGDMVIVEKGKAPRVGDIVIANVDGGFTMKYYRKKGNIAFLEAANKNYKPIVPLEEMKIVAVVKAVVRKY